jgi:hypothetical protein
LRFDVAAAHGDRVEFVGADVPHEHFVFAALDVPRPGAGLAHQRNGGGEGIAADQYRQTRRVRGILLEGGLLACEPDEVIAVLLILHGVAGVNQVLRLRSEEREQRCRACDAARITASTPFQASGTVLAAGAAGLGAARCGRLRRLIRGHPDGCRRERDGRRAGQD